MLLTPCADFRDVATSKFLWSHISTIFGDFYLIIFSKIKIFAWKSRPRVRNNLQVMFFPLLSMSCSHFHDTVTTKFLIWRTCMKSRSRVKICTLCFPNFCFWFSWQLNFCSEIQATCAAWYVTTYRLCFSQCCYRLVLISSMTIKFLFGNPGHVCIVVTIYRLCFSWSACLRSWSLSLFLCVQWNWFHELAN